MNWPIADAPQFRRRLSLSGYQKVFAAAVFAVHMYVLVRILWRDWGIGAIFASLVIAALMTTLIILAQFLLMPAINRRAAPMPIARLLGQNNPPGAGAPVHGGNPLNALRSEPAPWNTLPLGDEERRRILLVELRARLQPSTPAATGDAGMLPARLQALLDQEPLAVLEALKAHLRPDDDLAFFLHSWAAVPSTIKLDFLTFRSVFDGERLDAVSGNTAGAAAGVLRSVHASLSLPPRASLAIEGVEHFSAEGNVELLKVAYGCYLQLARTFWSMMSNAQRRSADGRAIYTQAASMAMTTPLAALVLEQKGQSAEILTYMERRNIHPPKINIASLRSHLARRTA